jgi:hypothetical protein
MTKAVSSRKVQMKVLLTHRQHLLFRFLVRERSEAYRMSSSLITHSPQSNSCLGCMA